MKKQLINKFKIKEIYHNEKKIKNIRAIKIKFLKISEWNKSYIPKYILFLLLIL